MAVTTTTRLGLTLWSGGNDPFNREQLDTSHSALEVKAAGFVQGTSRPWASSAYAGFFYFDTSSKQLSYCSGTEWVELSQYGSPSTLAIGSSASDGSATTVSRSDHTHGMPAAGVAVSVGTANGAGGASTFARSDHQHKLANGAINSTSLFGSQVVPESAIVERNVTRYKIGLGAVVNEHLGPLSVGTAQLQQGSVTNDKIVTVSSEKITGTFYSPDSIPDLPASKITSGTLLLEVIPLIPESKITGTISNSKLATGIDAAKLTGTMSGNVLPATIPGNKITTAIPEGSVPSHSANLLNSGTVNVERLPNQIRTMWNGFTGYNSKATSVFVFNRAPTAGEGVLGDIWFQY